MCWVWHFAFGLILWIRVFQGFDRFWVENFSIIGFICCVAQNSNITCLKHWFCCLLTINQTIIVGDFNFESEFAYFSRFAQLFNPEIIVIAQFLFVFSIIGSEGVVNAQATLVFFKIFSAFFSYKFPQNAVSAYFSQKF